MPWVLNPAVGLWKQFAVGMYEKERTPFEEYLKIFKNTNCKLLGKKNVVIRGLMNHESTEASLVVRGIFD